MKKVLSLLLVLAIAFSLVGCGSTGGTPTKSVSIGFVTDVGGIDDKSFNQSSWEGLEKFAKEVGLKTGTDIKYLQSASDADYIPNLTTFAEAKTDLVAVAGFMFSDAIEKIVAKYPDQKLLTIDIYWLTGANVQQAEFKVQEGSFLVGVVAGLVTKAAGKDKVGFIIGMESAPMAQFYAGYEAGVKAVFPECEIMYDNANAFTSAEIGKTLAAKQYNAGAYVIFHAAGGTGNGVIQEAAERRKAGQDVWVCGVDKDQYSYGIYEGEKSAVLTSMLKRVDIAAYNAAKDVYDGTFKGGVVVYDLKNNGVGIPENNPNFAAEQFKGIDFKAELEKYTKEVLDGKLVIPAVSPSGKGLGKK